MTGSAMIDALTWMLVLAAVTVIALGAMTLLTVVVIRRVVRARRPRFARILDWPPATDLPPRQRSTFAGIASRGLLPLRAVLPGPTRSIAALRWELTRDADAATRAVAAGIAAGRPVEQLHGATRRVVGVARETCLDLAVIGSEPDRAVRDALMIEQTDRIQALRRACAQIRRGVLLAGGTSTATLPRHLLDELDEEIDRLRLCAEAYHHLTEQPRGRRLHTQPG
jgi:hypothetical protein